MSAIQVGNGGTMLLGDGQIDLAGGDLQVNGHFDVGMGIVQGVGTVLINGSLNGNAGLIELWDDWINLGSFTGGSGEVHMVDAAGQASEIRGATTFSDLSMTTTAGGSYVLEAGLEQRVLGTLTILGLAGQPIQIESSSPPQTAYLWLDPDGTQVIDHVGVSNVHATGQPLAPTQTNQGGSGNDSGWFGQELEILAIPALSITGLLLLILALLAFGSNRQLLRQS